ncbi:MAG: hypothetical protein CMQ15_18510 [Gammaproteobacteria bacterium]|nr:hypothetical protein [Gammaproteobacteria bacterium]
MWKCINLNLTNLLQSYGDLQCWTINKKGGFNVMRQLLLIFLVSLFNCQVALGGETITAHEIVGYFYSDGEMKASKGQFEITYYIEGDTVTRTRVYDFKSKKVIPDNTIYFIQRQLMSDPSQKLPLRKQVIRAIGQPGLDAVEILVIAETYIQSVKSTSNYFVISRLKRIK